MCVYSMVVDHYADRFRPFMPTTWPTLPLEPLRPVDAQEFARLAKLFREAVEAARTVDRLTAQPNCEDPEKAKLVERVAALEKELASMKKKRRRRA